MSATYPEDTGPYRAWESDVPDDDSPDVAGASELAAVLDDVAAHFATYVKTVEPSDPELLALWCAHTYCCEATYTSPRLLADSPIPGSGKTTLLEHLHRLSLDAVLASSITSDAMIVRMMHERRRTLCIDEADRSLSPDKPGIEGITAVLNSGYKRGATRPVTVPDKESKGWRVVQMETYAPVAMAGNSPKLAPDTLTRTIDILCRPAADGEIAETDWELLDDGIDHLAGRLKLACESVTDVIRTNRGELPPGLSGRRKEVWRPLLRVALAAGGHWPEKTRAIIIRDIERQKAMADDGVHQSKPHVVLLADIRDVFGAESFMVTETELIPALIRRNPDMWGANESRNRSELTPQRLGRMLTKNFRISSHRPTSPKNAARGYRRVDFEAAWRYMAPPAPPTEEAGETGDSGETGDGATDEDDSGFSASAGFSGLIEIGAGTVENADRPCLICARHGVDSADVCERCRTAYETANRPPADVVAAISKMLADVAKRPRFNSGTDRIRDTISNKTVREQSNVALDACLEHGWLRQERIDGRPGYTITDSGRKHLQRFANRGA